MLAGIPSKFIELIWAPKEINLLLTCNVQALSKASLWGGSNYSQ
jgi:hypothetical protein